MDAMKRGAVLVVDEIEASLHPLLTRHLIEMMQNKAVNQNRAQLVFRAHEFLSFRSEAASPRSDLVCGKRLKKICKQTFML